jgi:alpha-tubulin suppressor-like RCC1 family protein
MCLTPYSYVRVRRVVCKILFQHFLLSCTSYYWQPTGTSDQHEPTFVDALREVGVSQIACGSGHTVVLSTDGEVYTWGRGDDGRLGHGDNGWKYVPRLAQSLVGQRIVQVTCGSYHTAAVSNLGELFTWYVPSLPI